MIPAFQEIMLPLLKGLEDKQGKSVSEIREIIIKQFGITDKEQLVKIPSGKQLLYYNRIAWAITYLKMAELIDSPHRSVYMITERGLELLGKNPAKINIALLKTYPGFNDKRNPPGKTNNKVPDSVDSEEIEEKTPG